MRQSLLTTAAIAITSVSAGALAHPGHDHGHWSSPALHAVFFLALAALAAGAGLWALRRSRRQRAQARAESNGSD